jgi:hypothetical protein
MESLVSLFKSGQVCFSTCFNEAWRQGNSTLEEILAAVTGAEVYLVRLFNPFPIGCVDDNNWYWRCCIRPLSTRSLVTPDNTNPTRVHLPFLPALVALDFGDGHKLVSAERVPKAGAIRPFLEPAAMALTPTTLASAAGLSRTKVLTCRQGRG